MAGAVRYASMADRLVANSVMLPTTDIDFPYNNLDGDPCWIWTGAKNAAGYPHPRIRAKTGPRKGKVIGVLAHRVSLYVFKGIWLTRRQVAKPLCNNNKACTNPRHLEKGTQTQNVRQCVAQGRHRTPFMSNEHKEVMQELVA